MTWVKRTIAFVLIMIPITLCIYLRFSPLLYDDKCFRVEGQCIDTYTGMRSSGKYSYTYDKYIVMNSGEHYRLISKADAAVDSLEDLEGKEIAFFAFDDIFRYNDEAFAFDQYDKETNEKQLQAVKRSAVGGIVFLLLLSAFVVAIPVFVPECLRAWKRHDDRAYKKDMLKRRKQKHAKKRKQAEKYSSLETFTEERHIQNKNMSKKKQKQRMKRNKPSNKN